MTDFYTFQKLLGLSPQTVTDEEIELPEARYDDIARGFTPGAGLQSLIQHADLILLPSPTAEELGFELSALDRRPTVVHISPIPPGFRLRHSPDETPKTFAEYDDELFIDFSNIALPVALLNENDEGILLRLEQQKLIVARRSSLPESSDFSFSVDSPLREWMARSNDTWAIERTEEKLRIDDPWAHLAAVGFFHRFEREENLRQRRQLLSQFLAGKTLPQRVRAFKWLATLSDETIDKLASLTLEAVNLLYDEIYELREDFEFGEDIDPKRVLSMLYLRDDIESALLLLNTTSARRRLKDATKSVDILGEELVNDFRIELDILDDERLRRATVLNPFAWWGALAREPFIDDL